MAIVRHPGGEDAAAGDAFWRFSLVFYARPGVAAALAEAIAAAPLRWHGATLPVSAAYGVHAFSGSDDPQRAIEAADRVMYQQKRATSQAGA